ncbi:hypothetical protein GH810_13895 [Acetobacterium paludosum]|uniref:Uncharacterized protein n=1 Tax=Acetobacterium paludosum TaxID=52693 RepID=A0A923HVQ3_9FIRM|nr:hypothetical protein [Acetobacterium paludosum]MBC3889403.1 hypothetical protein [Acetobacterium paludosum]
MSINGFRALWIRLQIEDRRFIKIPFPIPLYIFEELLDCFLDILIIACFFTPKVLASNTTSRISVHLVKELTYDVIKLLQSLNSNEPYDLIDVSTDKVKVLIKIR